MSNTTCGESSLRSLKKKHKAAVPVKKILSFSLWGDNPKYTVGAVKNAQLANAIYPEWTCRFYIGRSVPEDIVLQLRSFDNTEIIEMNEAGDWTSMFWRFVAADDRHVIMISRDTDGRLSRRERAAVDAWLASDRDFHIMRDHPDHRDLILGGMWGARNGIVKGISEKIQKYQQGNYYGIDQNFLAEKIYPFVRDKAFVHDTFLEKKPFPTEYKKWHFVGEPFDEHDNRINRRYASVRDYGKNEMRLKIEALWRNWFNYQVARLQRVVRLFKKILSLLR